MDNQKLRLDPEQLRRSTDPTQFTFETTADLPPLDKIIGQDRAVRSIDFGIDIRAQGYNIFVVGPPGSGRTSVVREFLDRNAEARPSPPEWCYVYNFDDPRRPKAISLAAGLATKLQSAMSEFVNQLQEEIPRAFEGEFFEQRRREITRGLQERQQELLQQLEKYLNERGFALIRNQMGLAIAPVIEGRVLSAEEYERLDSETKQRFERYRPELQEQFDTTMRLTRQLDREGRQSLDSITRELAGFVVDQLLDDAKERFQQFPKALAYMDAVRQDVVQNARQFLEEAAQQQQLPFGLDPAARRERWLHRYGVNVLVEACEKACAPIVIEDNPTYHNLIGRIEHRAEFGAVVTDFDQIREGALHRANGGYLVVEAKSLLTNPLAWDALKRALRNHQVKIEDMAQFYGLVAAATLEPEPIPLDVKVVIIGDPLLYELLYTYDEDFRELFKVKAQFAVDIPVSEEASQDYARFIGNLTRNEGLRPFGPGAIARIIDEASRLAESQTKVTTRMSQVADLVRESAYWAGHDGRDVATAEDVRHAVNERIYRRNYAAERYQESIKDEIMLIDVTGGQVGQVNGLSVLQMANFTFGAPSRVTARTYMGKAGIVSIDREVKMSGPIHDKGQLTLSAWLAGRFAQKRSLGLSATVTFEQSYGGVEGDSAASTELYALLSSLSDVPIKQNLAVTGSVNQRGQVQAIGGVNAKIEGFFETCKMQGLTGDQGVLIPRSNVQHLMLHDDVIEAVAQGKFHVYAVSTIEEGIELLTGVPAGEPDEQGDYPEGTLYQKIQAKLDYYAERSREEGKAKEQEREARAEQLADGHGPEPTEGM